MRFKYVKGQALPAYAVDWDDGTGTNTPVNFSSGYTFTCYVALASAPQTALITKTTNITGAATFPNVTVDWTTSEFSALNPASTGTDYVVVLKATRVSDGKPRYYKPGDPDVMTMFPATA